MTNPFCVFFHDSLVVTAILGVGLFIMLFMIIRWSQDSSTRERERGSVLQQPIKYLTPSGRGESFLGDEETSALPSVAFIMPVKWQSIKAASPVDNWRSQVLTAYKGKHESIFVVESEDDGAVSVLRELQEELKERAIIRIVVAGLATTCTQKIHNMVIGVDAAGDSMEYVFFLDANGHVHPGTLSVMVAEMLKGDGIFAVSGFPMDIPPRGASFWSWVLCMYRYIVLPETSLKKAKLAWGGAMLMRKGDIDNDVCEIKTRWTNGGYSDDVLVGMVAQEFGRTICMAPRALFPNTVKKDVTFSQAVDFIRRQVFTVTTFSSKFHCCMGIGLFFLYGVVKPLPPIAFLLSFATLVSFAACGMTEMASLWSYNLVLSVAFLLAFTVSMVVQRRYLRRAWQMTRSLSPGVDFTEFYLSRWTQVTAFLVEAILAPFIALSCIKRSSLWGGIRYHVSCGKVVRVEHSPTQANAHPAAPLAATPGTELKAMAAASGS